MDLKISMKKAGLLILLCMMIALSASNASAWWGGGGRHGGYYHGFYGHGGYHGWGFYRPYWGLGFSGYIPSVGAVVAYMPEGYSTFFINGIRYYYCDGYYFRSCPSGYVIVPEPVATTAVAAEPAAKSQDATPQAQELSATTTQSEKAPASKTTSADVVTINIPNSNGGYTAVKLVKFKDGYKGPQGEYYAGHPTIDELKVLYGK